MEDGSIRASQPAAGVSPKSTPKTPAKPVSPPAPASAKAASASPTASPTAAAARKSLPPETDEVGEPGETIRLHVPINGQSNIYVNIAQMIEEKYAPELPAQAFADRSSGEEDNDTDEGKPLAAKKGDGADEGRDAAAGKSQEAAAGSPKKRRRRWDREDYDKDDPFIDDSEAGWENTAALSKDGFFVYSGPLIPEGKKVRIEKADGTLLRGKTRGLKVRGIGSGVTSSSPRGRGRAPTTPKTDKPLARRKQPTKKPASSPKATESKTAVKKDPKATAAEEVHAESPGPGSYLSALYNPSGDEYDDPMDYGSTDVATPVATDRADRDFSISTHQPGEMPIVGSRDNIKSIDSETPNDIMPSGLSNTNMRTSRNERRLSETRTISRNISRPSDHLSPGPLLESITTSRPAGDPSGAASGPAPDTAELSISKLTNPEPAPAPAPARTQSHPSSPITQSTAPIIDLESGPGEQEEAVKLLAQQPRLSS